MKTKVIGIWLLLWMVTGSAQTNRLTRGDGDVALRLAGTERTRFSLLLGQQGDATPVRIMERLESDALQELCPGYTVYRLISTRDPIHYALFSALLIATNGVPTHLESDQDVADFLGSLTVRSDLGSTSNALQLVRCFAALRSYQIVESAPDFKDARAAEKQPALLASDFKFFAEERKSEWRVYATFFTSEYSGSYERYIFTIYKRPGAGFHFSDPVLIRSRNYVY